jgi:hypothetical protein
MSLKAGTRLFAQNSSCEVIVVKGADSAGSLSCAGLEMLPDAPGATAPQATDDPVVQLGKRYVDDNELIEVLCTKAGAGPLALDGRELVMKTAKPLPASD